LASLYQHGLAGPKRSCPCSGFRYATSVGGTLTGRGENIIIIDDPIKPEEAMSEARRTTVNDWFDRTLYSRLDNKAYFGPYCSTALNVAKETMSVSKGEPLIGAARIVVV
jgi:hypothetical protein